LEIENQAIKRTPLNAKPSLLRVFYAKLFCTRQTTELIMNIGYYNVINKELNEISFNETVNKDESRLVILFSCGITSYVAMKLALKENDKKWHLPVRIIYTYVRNENPDNLRFLEDVQRKLNIKVLVLMNEKYNGDIYEVQRKRKYISGVSGAPCTTELKWKVRKDFTNDNDVQVFGFNAGEEDRLDKFANANNDIVISTPLICQRLTKEDCIQIAIKDGLEIPNSYKEGYVNANCIGCVKGSAGYWMKVRKDYPIQFKTQSVIERELNATICKRYVRWDDSIKNTGIIFRNLHEEFHLNNKKDGFDDFDSYLAAKKAKYKGKYIRLRVFLDRLDGTFGRKIHPISCGVMCELELGNKDS